jgi:hypothetical protein
MISNEGNNVSIYESSNIVCIIVEDTQQILDTTHWIEIKKEDENLYFECQ